LDGGTLRQNVTQLQQASFGSTDANAIPADQTKTASDVLRSNPNSFAQVTSKLHSSEMVDNRPFSSYWWSIGPKSLSLWGSAVVDISLLLPEDLEEVPGDPVEGGPPEAWMVVP